MHQCRLIALATTRSVNQPTFVPPSHSFCAFFSLSPYHYTVPIRYSPLCFNHLLRLDRHLLPEACWPIKRGHDPLPQCHENIGSYGSAIIAWFCPKLPLFQFHILALWHYQIRFPTHYPVRTSLPTFSIFHSFCVTFVPLLKLPCTLRFLLLALPSVFAQSPLSHIVYILPCHFLYAFELSFVVGLLCDCYFLISFLYLFYLHARNLY